jgi:hypothetical protein|nr:MAG TPA: hypothetical protein [Caudoviricetes sp.]
MYKNYIHVQIDNEVFRINKKYEKFLFFYHIYLKDILTEEETELLRKYLTGRKYDKVFEMDKLKNMIKRITEEEYNALKK